MTSNLLPDSCATKRIGVALINGFALPGAATIVEVYDSANGPAGWAQPSGTRYKACLLSATGGRTASSSSVVVWTEGAETLRHTADFRALFVVGAIGVRNAWRDARLVTSLCRAHPRTELIVPIAGGRLLLDAAVLG